LSTTTTPSSLSSNKSPNVKSNALSNSHLPSPTLNNKTHHPETPHKKSQASSIKAKEKKTSLASVVAATASSNSGNNAMSNFYPTFGDDDINDVAAMGGVNLAEESQKILGSTEYVGTQIRSCKDEVLLNLNVLQQRIRHQMARHGLDEPPLDVAVLISHATQEYLKNITEKLSVIAEHRMDILKVIKRLH
jgi:transcription initiation factor TFIID subunit 4